MFRKLITTIVFLFLAAPAYSAESDFDKVCGYFVKLQTEISNRPLSKDQRADYISKLVNNELHDSSPAREAWELIIYAVPEERYEIYSTSAEEVTGKKWQCKAMEQLISTTGQ